MDLLLTDWAFHSIHLSHRVVAIIAAVAVIAWRVNDVARIHHANAARAGRLLELLGWHPPQRFDLILLLLLCGSQSLSGASVKEVIDTGQSCRREQEHANQDERGRGTLHLIAPLLDESVGGLDSAGDQCHQVRHDDLPFGVDRQSAESRDAGAFLDVRRECFIGVILPT